MSLRILELKAKQNNPRYSNNRCQILNMTNRGSVIGSNAKYGGAGCAKCSGGVRSTTCSSDSVLPNGCKNGCGCRFDGLSQPAPQMSYRNYLNKTSQTRRCRPCWRTLVVMFLVVSPQSGNKLLEKQMPVKLLKLNA